MDKKLWHELEYDVRKAREGIFLAEILSKDEGTKGRLTRSLENLNDALRALMENTPYEWSYLDSTPKDYVCGICRQGGVKLWRNANSADELFCRKCGTKDQKEWLESLPDYMNEREESDQLGCLLPAVPTQEGNCKSQYSFWGYTSVPHFGCEWWKDLPEVPIGYLEVEKACGY